jgi:hypothetical protein
MSKRVRIMPIFTKYLGFFHFPMGLCKLWVYSYSVTHFLLTYLTLNTFPLITLIYYIGL